MISECNVKIGKGDTSIIIPNNMIISCSFVESMYNLPNGRLIIKIHSSGIDKIHSMPSNIPIEVIVSTYEMSDASDLTKETTKLFKGIIIKHYTNHEDDITDKTVYVIEFISIGDDLSYITQLKSQSIVNSSVGAIQDISKSLNIPLNVTSKDLMTDDVMKWLICKKNYITAVESILNHSYLEGDDALYFTYMAKGETKIGSIKNEFNNPKNITFVYAKNKIDIVNKTIPTNKTNALSYFKIDISRGSAVSEATNSSAVTVKKPLEGNKKKSVDVGVTPGDSTSDKKSGTVGGVIGQNINVNSGNSNTHSKYGIAPIIRNNVYARYSNKITIYCPAENVVDVGDVVDVIVPTISTISSESDDVQYSKVLSGKYFVISKTYSYGGSDTFQFISSIELITDSVQLALTDKELFKNFGVKIEDIK